MVSASSSRVQESAIRNSRVGNLIDGRSDHHRKLASWIEPGLGHDADVALVGGIVGEEVGQAGARQLAEGAEAIGAEARRLALPERRRGREREQQRLVGQEPVHQVDARCRAPAPRRGRACRRSGCGARRGRHRAGCRGSGRPWSAIGAPSPPPDACRRRRPADRARGRACPGPRAAGPGRRAPGRSPWRAGCRPRPGTGAIRARSRAAPRRPGHGRASPSDAASRASRHPPGNTLPRCRSGRGRRSSGALSVGLLPSTPQRRGLCPQARRAPPTSQAGSNQRSASPS